MQAQLKACDKLIAKSLALCALIIDWATDQIVGA